jgi:hypothetical protein
MATAVSTVALASIERGCYTFSFAGHLFCQVFTDLPFYQC